VHDRPGRDLAYRFSMSRFRRLRESRPCRVLRARPWTFHRADALPVAERVSQTDAAARCTTTSPL